MCMQDWSDYGIDYEESSFNSTQENVVDVPETDRLLSNDQEQILRRQLPINPSTSLTESLLIEQFSSVRTYVRECLH